MNRKSKSRRRATILLMVVSLLALLFVIVTGFLSLARVDRGLTVEVYRAELTDAIVEDTTDWAAALLVDQLVDSAGRVLGGGDPESYSAEDIGGYRKTNWLAPSEPVWDAGATIPSDAQELNQPTWSLLGILHWPSVTSLEGSLTSPQPFALYELMPENADEQDVFFRIDDVFQYARRPFMDADADGVPDAHFLLSGPATEAANAAAGTPVQLPEFGTDPNDFKIYAIPGPRQTGLNYEKWQRFAQQARYEVAVRVISHGGMVALDAPTLYRSDGRWTVPFNREFTMNTFSAIQHPFDHRFRSVYPADTDQNRVFDELHAQVSAVEPLLRRRYFLPPAGEPEGRRRTARRVPPILAELQGEVRGIEGFPSSLLAGLGGVQRVDQPSSFQRINLAAQGVMEIERVRWAQAVALEPTTYNRPGRSSDGLNQRYDRRHLLTTVSNSDDLARKQMEGDPQPTLTQPLDLKTYQGERKFYLGEIAKAFDLNSPGPDQYQYNPDKGDVIIEELARLYYDMLASHSGADDAWGELRNPDPADPPGEVVSRRQQAFMLAVNTVAFGAPRDLATSVTAGWIDLVTYQDGNDFRYAGYAPQPFFTELVAYNPGEPDDEDEPTDPDGGVTPPPRPGWPPPPPDGGIEPDDLEADGLAIAVELFNPNDPYYNDGAPGVDVFALDLSQFAISVDEVSDPNTTALHVLSAIVPPGKRFLRGREFVTIAIKDEDGTGHFDASVDGTVSIPLLDPNNASDFHINLWRLGHGSGRQAIVDRISVRRPDEREWKRRARDTSPAAHFLHADLDQNDAGATEYARWNVAMGKAEWSNGTDDANEADPNGPTRVTLGNQQFVDRSGAIRDPDTINVRFAPTTPLITMNAAPFNDLPMFPPDDVTVTDFRPRSFPTVGFMLFIPRYAHAKNLKPTTGEGHHTVSWCLREQWERRSYRWPPDGGTVPWVPLNALEYPADFGHMPIFDNTQDVVGNTYLDEVGDLPWGLLVFDYFTTVNPVQDANDDGQPDVDPLRVPGRININAASWHVLANLPLMGPFDPTAPLDRVAGQLPIRVTADRSVATAADPSPSFWDPWVGALVGLSFDPHDLNVPPVMHYRLLALDPQYHRSLLGFSVPYASYGVAETGRYRLGPWLAQAAGAYRDGVQYVSRTAGLGSDVYYDTHLRNRQSALGIPRYRDDSAGPTPGYGEVRGKSTDGARPTEFGFVTVGELLNVKGFDSSTHEQLATAHRLDPTVADTALANGDFVKAVSVLALLDSQYMTTRSNTFTIYTSVMDREHPQASVRAQATVDRTNLLPRLRYETYNNLGEYDPTWPLRPVLVDAEDAAGNPGQDGVPETPVRTTNDGAEPRVIARQQVGYYNARYDD